MAASFYSIEEVMEKLQKSEQQIRDMVSQGKLREFRDGSKRLFKVNEVDALSSNQDSTQTSDQQDDMDMSGELDIMAGSGDLDLSGIDMDELSLELDDSQQQDDDNDDDNDTESEPQLNLDDTDDDDSAGKDAEKEAQEEEIKLTDDEDEDDEQEITLEPDEDQQNEDKQENPPQTEPATVDASEIGIEDTAESIGFSEDDDEDSQEDKHPEDSDQEDLDADDEMPDLGSLAGTAELNLGELTKADTSIGTTGINVLGDTDDDYKLSDDSVGETKIEDAEIDDAEDESDDIGNLDDDLNMDSVGSGSGLLDLSLQADDTSLGAVLDDILPGDEDAAANAAADEADDMAAIAEPSIDQSEDTGQPDQIFDQQQSPQINAPIGAAAVRQSGPAFIEPGSNAFGASLLISLIVMVVGALVLFAGFQGAFPGFVKAISSQMGPMGMYWYIMLGLMLLAVIISAMGWMAGTSTGTKKPKAAKPKKEKKPKKQKKKKK